MNEKSAKLIELVTENPDLEIKFMVNYEVCASDDHTYWLASPQDIAINEIFLGGTDGYGNDERVYIRRYDEWALKEYIVDYSLYSNEQELTDDERYDLADKIINALPWQKVILVYVDN